MNQGPQRREVSLSVRIHRQCLIRFLHEHAGVFGAFVDDDFDHHASAAKTFGVGRAVDAVRFDQAPLAARPPIAIEIGVRVLRIFFSMLQPAGIVEVNSVGDLVMLLLQRGEELVNGVLLRPLR